MTTEQRIRARAAMKRSALGMRWGMQRDADTLHERVAAHKVQNEALREQALMEQLMAGPDILRGPGDERGAAGFMETWLRTLRELTDGRS